MPDATSFGTVILGASGLITGTLALFSARANRSKINSETNINIANAEQSRENLYQSRETFLRTEMQTAKTQLEKDIKNLQTEMSHVRSMIEKHVLWDWEVIRQLKLAGIDFRDPPTLNYIRDKPEET